MSHTENSEVYWLAGIFDGEGSLVVHLASRRNHGYKITIQASVTNTDENIINEVTRISKEYDIEPHVSWGKRGLAHWKLKGEVWWYGQEKVLKLCQLLEPCIKGAKKEYMKNMINYLNNRLQRKQYHEKQNLDLLKKIIKLKQPIRFAEIEKREGRLYAR